MKRISLKWVPVVYTDYCTDWGICVEACSPKCLEIVNNVAVLTQTDKRGSEEHCIEPRPVGCIRNGMGRNEWGRQGGKVADHLGINSWRVLH